MKKYAFFKYFIKNKVFAGGSGGGAERPVPIGGGVGCSIFTSDMVWGRGRVHGSGGEDGDTQTRPRSAPLPCLLCSSFLSSIFFQKLPST